MSNFKIAFYTLGCKVNIYETSAMEEKVKNAGYTVVDFDESADIYVVNTCSVTNMADKKSRQILHRAKKENENAIIVAVGCYVQAKADELKNDNGIDILIGNNKKNEIVDILNDYINNNRPDLIANNDYKKYVIDIAKDRNYEDLQVSTLSGFTRGFIKIQDGCNQFCSYCIIPYTRGRVRSRNINDILQEAKFMAKQGHKEVVLTGIHLSSYGVDLKEDINLADVIVELGKIDDIKRIRIGSLEPRIITTEFLNKIKNVPSFCPHFHLSLQSGCDKILKLMNRRYTTNEFFDATELIRRFFSHPALTTDIIVGFPGENEEDFNTTYKFIKKIKFYEMHIFPYSKRAGTMAEKMGDTSTNKEKSTRAKILASLNISNKKDFEDEIIGTQQEILLEDTININGCNYIRGYTKEYIRIAIKLNDSLTEKMIIKGKVIGRLDNEHLLMDMV